MCIKLTVLKNVYVPNVILNGKQLALADNEKYLVCMESFDIYKKNKYLRNER